MPPYLSNCVEELPAGLVYPIDTDELLRQLYEYYELDFYWILFAHRPCTYADESFKLMWVHYVSKTSMSLNAGEFRMDIYSVPEEIQAATQSHLVSNGLKILDNWMNKVRYESEMEKEPPSRTLAIRYQQGELIVEEKKLSL
jgi:hypothetical protein